MQPTWYAASENATDTWGECYGTCDYGVRERTVTCRFSPIAGPAAVTDALLADSFCDPLTKPAVAQRCAITATCQSNDVSYTSGTCVPVAAARSNGVAIETTLKMGQCECINGHSGPTCLSAPVLNSAAAQPAGGLAKIVPGGQMKVVWAFNGITGQKVYVTSREVRRFLQNEIL